MTVRILGAACLLSAAAWVPAQAADLGGDCCADLEERIAELEATTARKGNRKVSLKVYGKVNEAIAYWDDGFEDNTYIYTNDTSRTRFGFKGKAKITDDWYAGFRIEIGVRAPDQGALDADTDDGGAGIDLRHSSWTLGSKTYGSVTVGETSMSHDGVTQIQTARIKHFSNPDVLDANDSFAIRQSGTGAAVGEWDNLAQVLEPGEGSRGNLVRYDTPTIAGFKVSAHWGEDDIWGAAIKYANKLGDFKVAGGVGYGEMTERDEECVDDPPFAGNAVRKAHCEEFGASASVLHVPTGLFVTGAYGIRWDDGRAAILQANGFAPDDENEFWHIQAGIQQKWTALGETTVFGGYHERDAGHTVRDDSGALQRFNGNVITNFEFEMWEIGLNQHIKAAAMDIYLHYKNYDADVTTTAGNVDTEEWQTVILGGHIKF